MRAYIDESYEAGPNGLYVLAAVVAHDDDAEVREAMLALRERWRGTAKLHFRDAEPARVTAYLDAVAAMDRPKIVVLTRPCIRPERASRKAMERFLWELKGRVDAIAIESRGKQQNRDDATILAALRERIGRFRYDFPLGTEEPTLWVSDILASGVFHAHRRDEAWILGRLGKIEQHVVDAH
ncbi:MULTISPECIES: hypothetical protein [unclassified Pseudofrankia]|uniref:hypothetical protein n=1 Tax=unclassified Pseudofrankia TaxID=2994372 RepID=UPI0008D908C3|nr:MULTISPECIES: hypothetical protein [unclassified Pseudofrankia]MDT3441126.1 hypothetical protein [Pseudofrankia sp. BMG5.37]OHV54271.1 hypothetical protein BCD48_09395 [Pseudofrankia sp. BMG5.36]